MNKLKGILSLGLILASVMYASAQLADDYGTGTSVARAGYCPSLSITMQRGSTDASTSGQVSQLQRFLIERSYLDIEQPTGRYAGMTVQAVIDFQRDQSLPTFGIAGSMTRAAIARVCAGGVSGGGSGVMCTQDAMVCPNGVSVGRTGPNCQFVCPTTGGTSSTGSVYITNLSSNSLSGQYSNIPSGTTLTIFNVGTSQQMSQTAALSAGSNTFTITLGNDIANGTYRIRILNSSGQVIAETGTFPVNRTSTTTTGSAPVLTVIADREVTTSGQSVTITWSSTNTPTSCIARNLRTGGSEVVLGTDGRVVAPTQTTTYRIECSNASGTGFADKTITVNSSTATVSLPVISITASPMIISSGQSTTITWSTTNSPTSCIARNLRTGGSETVLGTDGRVVAPTITTVYRVECTNSAGTGSAEKTISVTDGTQSTSLFNFVNGAGQAACNADIVSRFGSQVATCTMGGGCGVACGRPGASCASANPYSWGACVDSSAQSTGQSTQTPTVSQTPPTTAQLTLSQTTVSTLTNFSANWSGNNGPTRYTVRVNNTELPQGTNTTWTGTPASLGLAAGVHLISVQACNVVGCSVWSGVTQLTVTNPVTRNFVNGMGEAACNATIASTYGSQVATCTVGGGCDNANPGLWGACVTR